MRQIDWPALALTLLLIICIRETSVWLMGHLHHPELGNLFGLFWLRAMLLLYKRRWALPSRMLDANARIMKESALAFLPIAAGAGSMLYSLGHELPAFLCVLLLSTLPPLWLYARLARRWL